MDDVGDAELLEAGGPARRTTEDDEALRRPPHPGREVVEAEQLLEALRVLLVLLQRLDEGQLLVDERGVAAREGHEHGSDLGAQVRLPGRQRDGLAVHVVDGSRQLAELLLGVHVDRDDLVGVLAPPDPLDGLRQLHVGHVESTGTHPTERVDQGAGHDQRQDHRGEQREQDDGGVDEGTRLRGRGAVGHLAVDVAEQLGADAVVLTEHGRRGSQLGHLRGGGLAEAGAVGRDQGRDRSAAGATRLEVVEGRTLDSDLRSQPDGVEQRAQLARALDEQLLLDQREATVDGLDEALDPGVRRAVGGERRDDQCVGEPCHVAELDRCGGGDARAGAVAQGVADLGHLGDLGALGGVEVGRGCSLLEARERVGVGLVGVAVAVGAHLVGQRRRQRETLGGGEVGDGRAEDGGALLVGRVVARRVELGRDAQATEDDGEDDGEGQHRDDLAAH